MSNRFQQNVNDLSILGFAHTSKEVSNFGLRKNVLYHIIISEAAAIIEFKELTDEIGDAKLRNVELRQ